MARNPESARPISQFTSFTEIQNSEGNVIRQAGITRIPDKHTKRSKSLGLEQQPKAPKRSDLKSGQRPGLVKPKISDRQHVSEGLLLPVNNQVEDSDFEEYKEQGEKLPSSDSEIDIKSSPFAKLPIILYSPEDDLEPDALAEDSAEIVAATELRRLPEEIEGWEDYAATAIDLRS